MSPEKKWIIWLARLFFCFCSFQGTGTSALYRITPFHSTGAEVTKPRKTEVNFWAFSDSTGDDRKVARVQRFAGVYIVALNS